MELTNQHDEFGRMTERRYNEGGSVIAGFSYGYNEMGNKLYQEDLRNADQCELYGHDPEAQEYMQGLYEEKLQGMKWLRRGAVIILLGQVVCWWGLFPFPSADGIIGRMIVSLFPFGPVVLPFMIWVMWHIRSYRKDVQNGELKTVSGSYKKSFIKTSSSSGSRPIKI